MTSRKKCCLAVISVMLLSACGQRGPLYMPEEAPQNQPDQNSLIEQTQLEAS